MRRGDGWREEIRALALPAFLVWAGVVIIAVVGAALLGSALSCLLRRARTRAAELGQRLVAELRR